MDAGRENFPEHSPGWRRVLESLLHTFAKIPCEVKLGRFRHLLKLSFVVSAHECRDIDRAKRVISVVASNAENSQITSTCALPLLRWATTKFGGWAGARPAIFFLMWPVRISRKISRLVCRILGGFCGLLPALQPRAVARFRAC